MTTGNELKRIFDLRSDNAYTDYFDTAKYNRFFKQALIYASEAIYKQLTDQKDYDSLRGMIKVNRTFTPLNNVVYIDPSSAAVPNIPDYFHLLAVKCQFNELLVRVTFSAATNTSPVKVTLSGLNNIRTGDILFITGAIGNTNVNGLRYIKKINSKLAYLYLDKDFTIPVVGNGVYVANSATVYRYWYEYAQRWFSDRKLSIYDEPTPSDPCFEQDDNGVNPTRFIFQPTAVNCNEITIDYLTLPPFDIDVADATTDLERWYDRNLLLETVSQACMLAGQTTRDEALLVTSSQQAQQ